nr:hypothetical protein [Clostridium psychrophilum]
MRSFIERFMFPYLVYDASYSSLFGKKIPTGFIYTMNVNNEQMKAVGYEQGLSFVEKSMERLFGSFESLFVNDTYQFNDYSKYVVTCFDEKKKAQVRENQFPIDCKKVFNIGVSFVKQTILLLRSIKITSNHFLFLILAILSLIPISLNPHFLCNEILAVFFLIIPKYKL